MVRPRGVEVERASDRRRRAGPGLVLAALLTIATGASLVAQSPPDTAPAAAASPASAEPVADVAAGRRLFLVYCAECHGDDGDGWGMRQDVSYARPRSFQSARFKLATTDNRVPSDQDLFRTIADGMPGSGMPNWSQLADHEIESLVLFVRQLGIDALRDRLDADVEAGRRTPAEAQRVLAARTVPGAPVAIPPEPPADAAGLERGRRLYLEACAACHGPTGSPPYGALHLDFDGNRLPATSLRAGQLKGGSDGEQLYVRIAKGMDGTAMPAYDTAYGPDDLWHLVHHVQRLAQAPPEPVAEGTEIVAAGALSAPEPSPAVSADVSVPAGTAGGADQTPEDDPGAPRGLQWLLLVAVVGAAGLILLLAVMVLGSVR